MKNINLVLPLIKPKAPDCPDVVALEGIRQAARDFCTETRMWRSTITITTSVEMPDAICAPADASIVDMEAARYDGNRIEPISVMELNRIRPNWRNEKSDAVRYYTQLEPDTIRLVPLASGELELDLILKPKDGTDFVPNFLIDHHRSLLAFGALSYIYMIPGKAFSSVDMGNYYKMLFSKEVGSLTYSGLSGQQRALVRTKPSYF